MAHLLRNDRGMSLVGQGGRILLLVLPALVAAVLVHALLPGAAALPEPLRALEPVGYVLLAAGVGLWAAAVVQLVAGFSRGKLVTTGAYGVVRNPIYASVAFLVLPAVALLTQTWVYLGVSAALFVGVTRFIGEEERQLRAAFGADYEAYEARVARLVPFGRPRSPRRRVRGSSGSSPSLPR